MDNNKNRMKDREKSNAELRRMKPKDNADVGIKDGQKIGVHDSKHEKNWWIAVGFTNLKAQNQEQKNIFLISE